MTTELLTQIKDLLTPLRWYSVEDKKTIAAILEDSGYGMYGHPDTYYRFIDERIESIGKLPLTGGIFVNSVQKPVVAYDQYAETDLHKNDLAEYESAQSKVWFDGFEARGIPLVSNGEIIISFKQQSVVIHYESVSNGIVINSATVFDFIYHITKYNETATQKIEIHSTEAFVKMLIQ